MSKLAFVTCDKCGLNRRTTSGSVTCRNCRIAPVKVPYGDWITKAICTQTDPEMFFADSNAEAYAPAISVCNRCPVRDECLNYALANNITHGVWGGVTANQRRLMSRAS